MVFFILRYTKEITSPRYNHLELKSKIISHSLPKIILRWNVQRGVGIIPKSVHRNRMEENLAIWNFELSAENMHQIATLDLAHPLMLDPRKPSEVHRLFNYLENPVLTSL